GTPAASLSRRRYSRASQLHTLEEYMLQRKLRLEMGLFDMKLQSEPTSIRCPQIQKWDCLI
ncbi:hypothetical protein BgiBS90_002573, partial [Biomphalaria glabrata]